MDLKSLLGYSKGSPYAGNPYLDIHTPEGLIDMSNTPFDLIGIDNKGNKKKMKAGRKNPYQFEGDMVREIPIQQRGGTLPTIKVTNPNDPRLKAYSDSLKLYNKGLQNKKELGKDARELLYSKYPNDEDMLLNFYSDTNTEAHKDWKKTGILPDREFVGNYSGSNGIATGYNYGYKKPVQPVVYQKPQPKPSTRTVEYTDPLKFKQAQQAYSDSLNLYNHRFLVHKEYANEKHYNSIFDQTPQMYTKKEAKDATYGNFGILDTNSAYLFGSDKLINNLRNTVKRTGYLPIGREGVEGDIPMYKKPVVKPVLKEEQLFPLQPAVKGSMKVTAPQQEQIPEPTGQPVYGPSNGLIGYQTKNGFQPTLRRDHLAKNNQADIDLLNSPEALQKYVTSTPRYQRGGINPYTEYTWSKNSVQKGGNPFSKRDILNFLYEDDYKKEDIPTAPAVNDLPKEKVTNPDTPDSDYEMAMMAANGEAMNNPLEIPIGTNPYRPINNGTSNVLSQYGSNFTNLDSNVASATQELITRFPNLRLTSGRRNWGDKDAHPKGRAVDLSYDAGAFDFYKNVLVPKYGFNQALNPNHGTGPHIHLGYY